MGVLCTCAHTEARGHLASCTVILHIVSGDRSLSEPRARPSSIVLGLWARLAMHGYLRGCWRCELHPTSTEPSPCFSFSTLSQRKMLGVGFIYHYLFSIKIIYILKPYPKGNHSIPRDTGLAGGCCRGLFYRSVRWLSVVPLGFAKLAFRATPQWCQGLVAIPTEP